MALNLGLYDCHGTLLCLFICIGVLANDIKSPNNNKSYMERINNFKQCPARMRKQQRAWRIHEREAKKTQAGRLYPYPCARPDWSYPA